MDLQEYYMGPQEQCGLLLRNTTQSKQTKTNQWCSNNRATRKMMNVSKQESLTLTRSMNKEHREFNLQQRMGYRTKKQTEQRSEHRIEINKQQRN